MNNNYKFRFKSIHVWCAWFLFHYTKEFNSQLRRILDTNICSNIIVEILASNIYIYIAIAIVCIKRSATVWMKNQNKNEQTNAGAGEMNVKIPAHCVTGVCDYA